MKKFLYLLLFTIVPLSSLFGQQVLTLEECIQIALDNNLNIKRARNDAMIANLSYRQSKFNFLPALSASANHRWNEGLQFDQTSGALVNTTTLGGGGSIVGNMTIFDGFQNRYNMQRSGYLAASSEHNISSTIQTTEASIVGSFLQYISTKESLKIAEETLGLLEEQLDQVEKRQNAGVGNMEQVYNFRSQVAQQQLTIVDFKNSIQSSKLTLVQLLLLDPSDSYEFSGVTITDEALEAEIDAYEELRNESLEFSPAIKAAELNLEASKRGLKIAQNSWLPSLTVGASYGTGWSSNVRQNNEVIDLSTQFQNNLFKSASFNLNIPLFTRFNNQTQLQQSKIQVVNSELSVEQAKNNITNLVQQAYLNLVNAKTSFAAAKESLVNLNMGFEFSKSRYENGTIDFVTYLQSLNGKNRGELQLVQAKYTILFRKLILDIYTGELNNQN